VSLMDVILNADDFGLSLDTVETTIECFERGAITSATIMPAMPSTREALEFAAAHPDFGFGVHLTFVGGAGERPVSPPDRIPSLVGDDGAFLSARDARLRALAGRLDVGEIERECKAQIDVVRAAGVAVSHVDSHKHMHKFAPFRAALLRVLPTYRIAHVRAVQDIYLRWPLTSPTYWLGRRWGRWIRRDWTTTDHFFMPTADEGEDWPARLVHVLEALPGRTVEIGVHPGRDEPWRARDAAAVVEAADTLRGRRHRLVDWRTLVG